MTDIDVPVQTSDHSLAGGEGAHARSEQVEPHEPPVGPAAADPALIGLPTFIVGALALGLTQVGFVSAESPGAPVAIVLFATGLGQLISAVWAAAVHQGAVAGIFGTFTGFWLSYGALVLGLTHGWYGVAETDAANTKALFLISWAVVIGMLTLASLRLPAAFTVLFSLVTLSLVLALAGALAEMEALVVAGGVATFALTAVGIYLFFDAMATATGGKSLPLGKAIISS